MMNTANGGAEPTTPQAKKIQKMSSDILDVSEKKVTAVNSDAQPADPPSTPAMTTRLPPLTAEDREKLYERLRNNVPEPLQTEHRWGLLRDTGKKCKMPIGGHPSYTKNLEEAITEHRTTKNNALAIGYSTGGKMSYGEKRVIPPDPHCIWLDYDDLKDADGNTIAAPEIIEEIENLRISGAYVEISMSGKGMHVCIPKPRYYDEYCKGVSHKCNQPEVFGNGQYVAVTGRIYGDKLPNWPAFAANPFATKLVKDIITRAQAWKKGIASNIYDTEEEADNRVIARWQALDDPKPSGSEALTKIAELVADVDFCCETQYLCPETIRRLWMPVVSESDAAGIDVDGTVTAAYETAVALQERRREELKKQREEERQQTEARLRTEFHVSAENVPTITFNGPDTDWDGKITAVNYIDGFCTRNIPKKSITDPSNTAYRICVTVLEYLAKHDPDHCTLECINTVFMECKLFPYLYGPEGMHRQKYPDGADDGWNPRKAGLCLANIWKKHEEQKQDIQNQIAAQKRIAETNAVAEKKALDYLDSLDSEPRRMHTLGDCARYMASNSHHYIGARIVEGEVITDPDGTTHPKLEPYFFKRVYRALWHKVTYLVAISDSKSGWGWYDGCTWQIDPHGVGIKGAINQGAELTAENTCDAWAMAISTPEKPVSRDAAAEQIRQICNCAPDTLSSIAALRLEASVTSNDGYGKGLTCQDGVIIIDANGIHKKHHDPNKEVWYGYVPASINDLLPNLAEMTTLEEVVSHFPNFKRSLDECDEPEKKGEKVKLFASMAGVLVYYTQPNHKPLEAWYYLWDAGKGGTGKSTHLRMMMKFFEKYAASGVSWETFTGANSENGGFLGKICVECEEAGVNGIKSVETVKSRTSGGWEYKSLYMNRTSIQQPLLLISAGNSKPMIAAAVNTRPVWDRLQPCEFTVKIRNSGREFPCSEREYFLALLNVGCWVAHQLKKIGKGGNKTFLPYFVTSEEVEILTTRVAWFDVLQDIGGWEEGREMPLDTVLTTLKETLRVRGYTDADLKGAPELKTPNSFRLAINGRNIRKLNEYEYYTADGRGGQGQLKVVENTKDKRETMGRYLLRSFKFKGGVNPVTITPVTPTEEEEIRIPTTPPPH